MAKTRNRVGAACTVAAAMEDQNAAFQEIVRGASSAATGAQGITENVGMRQGATKPRRHPTQC